MSSRCGIWPAGQVAEQRLTGCPSRYHFDSYSRSIGKGWRAILSGMDKSFRIAQSEVLTMGCSLYWTLPAEERGNLILKIRSRTRSRANKKIFSLFGLVLGISFSSAVLAQAPISKNKIVASESHQMKECNEKTDNRYEECQQLFFDELEKESHRIDKEIKRELSNCRPEIVGYDYELAQKKYVEFRKYSELNINAFCDVFDAIFGQGTARTESSLACIIDRKKYEISQAELILEEVVRVRRYLKEVRHGSSGELPGIICK